MVAVERREGGGGGGARDQREKEEGGGTVVTQVQLPSAERRVSICAFFFMGGADIAWDR